LPCTELNGFSIFCIRKTHFNHWQEKASQPFRLQDIYIIMGFNAYACTTVGFFPSRKKLGFYKFDDHVIPVYEWADMNIYPIKRIMDNFMEVICEAFSRTSRVMMVRFDLRVREHTENNRIISDFTKLLSKKTSQYSQVGLLQLVWVREHSKSAHQHYHAAIFTNGHLICHPAKLLNLVKECWIVTCNGSMSIPKNCYYDCKRGDSEHIGKMIYRLSYLAKNITKRRFNFNTRRFSVTRIDKSSSKPTLTLLSILNS